jgi:NhaA family Na+:H+ antiporter
MPEQDQIGKRVENGIIYAPWERAFARVPNPFEEYIHRETTSGLLSMGIAIIALLLAKTSELAGVPGSVCMRWSGRKNE